MNTTELARQTRTVSDALIGNYDHLPPIGEIASRASRHIYLAPNELLLNSEERLRAVPLWAAAFGVPVSLRFSPWGELQAEFMVAGVPVVLYVLVDQGRLQDLAIAAQVRPRPDVLVEVPAEQLLAVLQDPTAAQVAGDLMDPAPAVANA